MEGKGYTEGNIFPLSVNVQLRVIDGKMTKMYVIYNNDGNPISETPRTREEIEEIIRILKILL